MTGDLLKNVVGGGRRINSNKNNFCYRYFFSQLFFQTGDLNNFLILDFVHIGIHFSKEHFTSPSFVTYRDFTKFNKVEFQHIKQVHGVI